MAPDHPSTPPGPDTFSGTGMFLTFQVTEAWGQRRFALRDPAGTWIDVVEQTDPAPGFWDRYLG